MGSFIDLTGQKFNRLTVINRAESKRRPSGKLVTYWNCKCECGNITTVRQDMLKNGHIKSCDCSYMRHGKSQTRIYTTWFNMRRRCYNIKDKKYNYYGGRGIKVCNEWNNLKNGFINFYNWAMTNGYNDNLTIDRIDVNGNYEPNNCRWATYSEQNLNRRKKCMIV